MLTSNPYMNPHELRDPSLLPVLIVSILLHVAVLSGSVFLPGWLKLGAPAEPPFEYMTVQLMGGLEPPAPAAPPAPVDPTIQGPDVVELPKSDPIIPQPTSLEQMITPVIPSEAIPIGERPPDKPIEQVEKIDEPPPKVTPPPKPIEEQPKPPPRRRTTPNPEARLNNRIEELRRKREAENQDEQIDSAVGNIARARGQGNGTSSNQSGPGSQGQRLHPDLAAYYYQIREIVRSNWVPPALGMRPDLRVIVGLIIQPNGRISAKNLRTSSGDSVFDQSVLQAIDRSMFPPLPAILEGKPDNPAMMFQFDYLNANR
ncbi:MAG: TonB family protein [Deltaproteobacteria bacterium]|jgi:TonB family protein|nr:TonB family protein [Deltaproteobacteria bacterium]